MFDKKAPTEVEAVALLLKLTSLETTGTNILELKGCCFCMAALALWLPEARVETENALLLFQLEIKALVQSSEGFNKWCIHVGNWERNKNRIEIDSVDCGAYIKKEKSKNTDCESASQMSSPSVKVEPEWNVGLP